MIYFRDREYVLPVNVLNEKEAYKGFSLLKALEKIQQDFNEYQKNNKGGTIKDYVQYINDNPDRYVQTSTDSSNNVEYVQTSTDPNANVQYSIELSATKAMDSAAKAAEEIKTESVMVNNGMLTLEQYNFLNN